MRCILSHTNISANDLGRAFGVVVFVVALQFVALGEASAQSKWSRPRDSERIAGAPNHFRYRATAIAGHEKVIVRAGQLNVKCELLNLLTFNLDSPPRHGIVCTRQLDFNAINAGISGKGAHCIGREVKGLALIYLPRSGYSGADEFQFTARGKAPPATTTIVDVNVRPDKPEGSNALPRDVAAPVPEVVQPSGPVPACAALSS